ncbi:transglycosylase SLT domain-containing protein [Roseomonas sp. WA12]
MARAALAVTAGLGQSWAAALFLLAAPASVEAQPAGDDAAACRRAIAQVEPGSGIPPGLLGAIALVESGRAGAGEVAAPWPWTYNAAGQGHYAPTREAAIAEVAALRASGVQSIDVGCMQVNLLHHPDAFASLSEAFDPIANTRYAAGYLLSLYAAAGAWGTAVARYHSGDPGRGEAYGRRVALAQLGRAWAGGGTVSLPGRPGLCGRGAGAVLVLHGVEESEGSPVAPRIACRRSSVTPRAQRPDGRVEDGVPVAAVHRVPRRHRQFAAR